MKCLDTHTIVGVIFWILLGRQIPVPWSGLPTCRLVLIQHDVLSYPVSSVVWVLWWNCNVLQAKPESARPAPCHTAWNRKAADSYRLSWIGKDLLHKRNSISRFPLYNKVVTFPPPAATIKTVHSAHTVFVVRILCTNSDFYFKYKFR